MSDGNQATDRINQVGATLVAGAALPQPPHVEYNWILDEDLLRDEGIIYGLTDSDVNPKKEVIQYYFDIKIATEKAKAEALINQIEDMATSVVDLNQIIDKLQQQQEVLFTQAHFSSHLFFQSMLKTLAYCFAVSLTFLAVLEWTGPLWEFPVLVTAGVYIFGGLSMFHHQSILFQKNEEQTPALREPWKIVVEEFIVPFAATFFIMTWRAKPAAIEQIISFALLLYLLFLFSGKGFISSLTGLKMGYHDLYNDILKNRYRRKKIEDIKEQIDIKKTAIADLLNKKEQLAEQYRDSLRAIKQLDASAKTKIAYLLSEYELAKSARSFIANEQLVKMGMHKKSS